VTAKKDDEDNLDSETSSGSLLSSLMKITGQVAGSTLELARSTATMTAMFGENWLRSALLSSMEPERLEAMAEAGHFLKDAREMAGLSMKEVADSLGLSDNSVLEEVEGGQRIMPLDLMLRTASLLARHDPIPFLIKFMRTYNPALERRLEQWGVLSLPKHFERERRFVNIYRQHDALRDLSDEEHERFIEYMNSSTELVLDVMLKEKAAAGRVKPKVKAKTARPRKTVKKNAPRRAPASKKS